MRNSIFAMAAALLLAACGESPTASDNSTEVSGGLSQISGNAAQIQIADIDFFNMSETHDIATKLAPSDAPLFLEYVINWKAAKVSGDQSKILKSDGSAPVTIADAIALTKAALGENASS